MVLLLKVTHLKNLLKLILLGLLMLLSGVSASSTELESAQADTDQHEKAGEQSGEKEGDVENIQTEFLDYVEREKNRIESHSLRAAQWIDSFFSDPEYEAEVVTSQFRLRPELYYRREQGLKPKLKAAFKIRLPNIERHVSLVGGSSDFDSDFDSAVDDDVNEPTIGLHSKEISAIFILFFKLL